MGSSPSITSTNVDATAASKITNMQELNKQIEKRISSASCAIPGLSLAIISLGSGIKYFNYGYQDLSTMHKTTSQTVYHLFSGTKLFTATAIMQLVQHANLKLDDPVTQYLPQEYITKFIETNAAFNKLSIAHLLTHSSGIDDKMKQFMGVHFPQNTPFPMIKALQAYGALALSEQKIGQRAKYCNFGYSLLGEIIHNANSEQLSYQDYMKVNIFQPLQMNVSMTYDGTFHKHDIATGYIHSYSIFKPVLKFFFFSTETYSNFMKHDISKQIGDIKYNVTGLNEFELDNASIGGILGSVEEISKFVVFQMEEKEEEKGEVLGQKYIEMMQQQQQGGSVGIESKNGVGYGWKMGLTADQRKFINHEGGGPGFHSEMRIYPDSDLGIVICSNYATVDPSEMAKLMHVICEDIFHATDNMNQ